MGGTILAGSRCGGFGIRGRNMERAIDRTWNRCCLKEPGQERFMRAEVKKDDHRTVSQD